MTLSHGMRTWAMWIMRPRILRIFNCKSIATDAFDLVSFHLYITIISKLPNNVKYPLPKYPIPITQIPSSCMIISDFVMIFIHCGRWGCSA